MKPILGFDGEYRWLSNFHPAPVTVIGFDYQNTEAAYQAAKTINLDERAQFQNLTGGQAKRAGKKLKMRDDWHLVKFEVMELVLRAKFMAHPDLAKKLVATRDAEIIELNTWGDTTWGQIRNSQGNLIGQNYLGKLLMNIREDVS